MARRDCYAIINPVAGHCAADEVEQTLRQTSDLSGLTCEIYRTTGHDDLNAVVQAAYRGGHRRFIAAGGDGTIAAVSTALLDYDAELAIVPVGTANLLARELAIPLTLPEACWLAAQGQRIRYLDAITIGDRVCLSRVTFGSYSRITERASPVAKRYFRQFAYVWSALPELFGGHRWRFALELDDRVSELRAAFIIIANVSVMGAGELHWGEKIAPDNGRLDVCVVNARSLWDYMVLGWHLINRQPHEAPKLHYFHATRRVVVKSRKPVPVRADGETVDRSAVTLELRPGSVAVVVPGEAT